MKIIYLIEQRKRVYSTLFFKLLCKKKKNEKSHSLFVFNEMKQPMWFKVRRRRRRKKDQKRGLEVLPRT